MLAATSGSGSNGTAAKKRSFMEMAGDLFDEDALRRNGVEREAGSHLRERAQSLLEGLRSKRVK